MHITTESSTSESLASIEVSDGSSSHIARAAERRSREQGGTSEGGGEEGRIGE